MLLAVALSFFYLGHDRGELVAAEAGQESGRAQDLVSEQG